VRLPSGDLRKDSAWRDCLLGAISRGNPALAVGSELHKKIGVEQRALGLFNPKVLQGLSADEVISRNVLALRRAGVPEETITLLEKKVRQYAATLPT
jgi:hypothetical protein